ncbi:unnamed protein product [Lepeophtheirus salmonis]|uniref:(salmon louse) hypothetical protein n=1 Tax=Lepeophtheirus salmonis TaxID=72036 RepID=A0A7R8CTP7_LEPSM|nr:unnamed protein product [Lepeophtheirus salmonis]CAF2875471.1 unnamed protein product [Lepeophtheirus salmonis]
MSNNNTSGVWEVVGKPSSKKSSSKSKKTISKNGGSGHVGPRAEDVLPLKQVRSWYANAYDTPPSDSDEEPSKKAKKSTDVNEQQSKNTKKKTDPAKKEVARKPNNIMDAAALVHASDLKAYVHDIKVGYPDLRELWVREIALYLNGCLETTEKSPEFLSDPFSDQPISSLFRETKKIITSTLEEASGPEKQSIFDSMLANIAHYMAKGKSVNGYLTVIQVLLEAFPNICCGNVSKLSELRNSYQNQPAICLALLWAVGQGGKHDLRSGLKAWLECMVPLLPLRSYHKFILNYLSKLMDRHTKSDKRVIFPSQFMQFIQVFFFYAPSCLNKELAESLMKNYSKIKDFAIADGSNDFELFPHLMRRLTAPESQTNQQEQTEIIVILQQCIINSQEASLSQWHQMYSSYIPQSSLLLEYMVNNWSMLPRGVKNSRALIGTLEAFRAYNLTNETKDGVTNCDSSCRILLSKMASNESKAWFPWKTACLILTLVIFSLVHADYNKHKTLKASNTGRLLSDIGLYDNLIYAFDKSNSSLRRGMKWMEEKSPEGMQMMRDGKDIFIEKAQVAGKVVGKYVSEGYVSVSDYVNEHGPGVKAKAQYWFDESVSSAGLIWEWSKEKAPHAKKMLIQYTTYGLESTKTCINDIIEGKTDLTDIKNYVYQKFNSGMDFSANQYKNIMNTVE